MNDSADIKSSAAALDTAVDSLERALSPILGRIRTLELASQDHDAFREDRAKLAAELDKVSAEAQDRAASFQSREAEFNRLATQTEAELERAITEFTAAMGG
jgi:cytochrome c556